MLEFLRTRLRQGTRTIPVPVAGADLPARFRGLPVVDPAPCVESGPVPSALHTLDAEGRPAIDVGACLFSPEEEGCGPAGAVRFVGYAVTLEFHDHSM